MACLNSSTLAALYLRDAQFGLRHDGRFWVATFQARPHAEMVSFTQKATDSTEAVAALGHVIIDALQPGGLLAVGNDAT